MLGVSWGTAMEVNLSLGGGGELRGSGAVLQELRATVAVIATIEVGVREKVRIRDLRLAHLYQILLRCRFASAMIPF